MNKTNKIRYFPETGFTETLRPITLATPNINHNACVPIYMNGMNSNKINFFQSEFPNLTKIKPLIRLNQNSVKMETPKKDKPKVSFAIPNSNKTKTTNKNTNTKKKKFRFSMPKSKTNPTTKSKTKKVY
jgi:hypothetical protein